MYSSDDSSFHPTQPKTARITLQGDVPGSISELAHEISSSIPSIGNHACYLAGLLLGIVTDVPITASGTIIFASPQLLRDTDEKFKEISNKFLAVRNLIRIFPSSVPLAERVRVLRDRLEAYGNLILERSQKDSSFEQALKEREEQVKLLGGVGTEIRLSYTRTLLTELAEQANWGLLEPLARRHLSSPDEELSAEARRMLAICQAEKAEREEHQMASRTFLELARSRHGVVTDFSAAANLLHGLGEDEEAKKVIIEGIERFPVGVDHLAERGQQLAMDTGDKAFRQRLEAYRKRK